MSARKGARGRAGGRERGRRLYEVFFIIIFVRLRLLVPFVRVCLYISGVFVYTPLPTYCVLVEMILEGSVMSAMVYGPVKCVIDGRIELGKIYRMVYTFRDENVGPYSISYFVTDSGGN